MSELKRVDEQGGDVGEPTYSEKGALSPGLFQEAYREIEGQGEEAL